MSASMRLWGACRALAVRSKLAPPRTEPFFETLSTRRWYSASKPSDVGENIPRIPEKPSPVSRPKEAAEPAREQEVKKESQTVEGGEEVTFTEGLLDTLDDAALEHMLYGGRVAPREGDPGLTEAQEQVLYNEGKIPAAAEAELHLATSQQQQQVVEAQGEGEIAGHKFPLPQKPYGPAFNHKERYHPVLGQLTRLLMRDGKLSVAQRNMAIIMNHLRTSPAPIYSPKFPLLPGTPPASHLPLNPVLYITIAIDSVAPLLKVKNVPGAAGGGRALEVPTPLAVRQRRRMAFKWILDVVDKKPSKGSGRKQFPLRIAEEVIAVIEGRSGVWDRRKLVHKLGTASRANAGSKSKSKKRKI